MAADHSKIKPLTFQVEGALAVFIFVNKPCLTPTPATASSNPEGSTLQRFATRHRLKTRVDSDETRIIPGRDGQLYEHAPGQLAVMFLSARAKSPGMWNNRRRAGEAVGMTLYQNGDQEGVLTFDPLNAKQVALAIKIASIKRKRIMSPAQKEILARATSKSPIGKRVWAQLQESFRPT
jgi:hypothetical protein